MICRVYDVPGATREQYDEVISKLGVPEEAHVHIAGPTENGWTSSRSGTRRSRSTGT